MRKLNATDAEQDKFDIQSELNVISYALSCGTQNFYSNLDELSFEQFSGRDNASVYKTICDLYEKCLLTRFDCILIWLTDTNVGRSLH